MTTPHETQSEHLVGPIARRRGALATALLCLVGCTGFVPPPVSPALDAGITPSDIPTTDISHADVPLATDRSAVADAPDAADTPDAVDAADAADAADALDATDAVDAPDAADAADAVDASDATDSSVVSPMVRTHPLASAADVVALFNLHQLVGTSARTFLERAHNSGDARCPGPLVRADGRYTGNLVGACTASRAGFMVDFGGSWHHEWNDPCVVTNGPKVYDLTADAVTLRGADDGQPVEFAFDGTVHMSSETGRFEYAWQGSSQWVALPSSWAPSTGAILVGRAVRGVNVTRAGNDADGYRFDGWIGIAATVADAGAERGAQFETVEPIRFGAVPTCFQPTSGRLRLRGAVDVEIAFAAGAACAPPTWSRDGVAMGAITLNYWGYFTLCGGTR